MKEVWVTGVGVVSPMGEGIGALCDGLRAGRRALTPSPLAESGFPVKHCGVIPGFEAKRYVSRRKDLKLMSRDACLAVAAGTLALEDAGLPLEGHEGLGIFMGVGYEKGEVADLEGAVSASRVDGRFLPASFAEAGIQLMNPIASLKTLPNMPLAHLSIRVGAMGPNLALAPDEHATRLALTEAVEAVGRGECERALAGGADCLTTTTSYALAWRHGRLPVGVSPGEGAAFLLLEAADLARSRGARHYRRAQQVPELNTLLGFAGAAAPALVEAASYGLGGRR